MDFYRCCLILTCFVCISFAQDSISADLQLDKDFSGPRVDLRKFRESLTSLLGIQKDQLRSLLFVGSSKKTIRVEVVKTNSSSDIPVTDTIAKLKSLASEDKLTITTSNSTFTVIKVTDADVTSDNVATATGASADATTAASGNSTTTAASADATTAASDNSTTAASADATTAASANATTAAA